jgi:excisionase family DNA binding protein
VIKLEKEILTLEEAAEYLRMNPEVLRRHVKKGDIPGKQIGRVWKFSKRLLQKYIEEGYNESINTNRKDRE